VDVDVIGKLLIRYSAFIKTLQKIWEYNGAVHHIFTDSVKA
jgi:hypothetical protein